MSCPCQCRQCKLCNQPRLLQPLHAMHACISESAEATRRRQSHQVCTIASCNCFLAYVLLRHAWQNPSSFAELRWRSRCVAGMNRARIVGGHSERCRPRVGVASACYFSTDRPNNSIRRASSQSCWDSVKCQRGSCRDKGFQIGCKISVNLP